MTGRAAPRVLPALLLAGMAATAGPAQAAAPSLLAYANATRVRSPERLAPLRLVDTSWWISVDGASGGAPLAAIEFHARFTDPEGQDQRPVVGTIELGSDSRERAQGRIDVSLPTRPDYLRPFRVRLRLRDAAGETSGWVEVHFPVRAPIAPAGETPVAVAAAGPPETREVLGQVETEVDETASMGDVRRALLLQARIRGGTGIDGIRLLRSEGGRSVFAADAVRVTGSQPPTPGPEATPPAAGPAPRPERILGVISVRDARR